mmetsp:Transcript_93039/g.265661  ORF Transcript_93039/g.265661 Transcript_93039/m.265661 type:complete len:196 (+) Transcript_93039:474-1061(+)
MQQLKPSKRVQKMLDHIGLGEDDIGVHIRLREMAGVKREQTLQAEGCTKDDTAIVELFVKSMKRFDEELGPNPKRRFWVAADVKHVAEATKDKFPRGNVLIAEDLLGMEEFEDVNPMGLDLWALASTSMIIGTTSTFARSAAVLGKPTKLHMLKHCNGSTGPGLTPAASFCAGPPCVGAQDYFKNGTQVRVEIDR